MRTLAVALTALAWTLVAGPLVGCSPTTDDGVLIYRAEHPEGGDLSARELRLLATNVQVRIGELGIRRREVGAIPPRTLRVVLPLVVAPRIPEIREALEDATDIPAKLTFVQRGD